jgi:hypothetical protein
VSKKVKIRTTGGLDAFLSLLAEEGVVKARSDLRNGTYASEEEILQRAAGDEKKAQGSLGKDLDRLGSSWGSEFKPKQAHEEADEDIFKSIASAGGEGGDKSDKKPEKKKKAAPEQKPDAEAEPDEDQSTEEEPDEHGQVGGEERISFTMIRDELNFIRSGRSLRNKDIRAELKDYVTGLDTDERIALHAFLKGIGQILTAGIDSEQADEPSEDPHDIKMSRDDGSDSGGTTPRPKQKQKKKHGAVKKPVNRAKQRGLEDTSAPIQVGRKQATEGIRRRIRELMG